jgi:hypothetical protein
VKLSVCFIRDFSDGVGRGLEGRGRGFDMGSITVPDRALQRQKKPSVTLVFCKLRPSFSLSRQLLGPFREVFGTGRRTQEGSGI